jgi:hypothetical protein
MCFHCVVGVSTGRAKAEDDNCPICNEPALRLDMIVPNRNLRQWLKRIDGELSYKSQRAELLKHIVNLPQQPAAPIQPIPSLAAFGYRHTAAEPYHKRPRYC